MKFLIVPNLDRKSVLCRGMKFLKFFLKCFTSNPEKSLLCSNLVIRDIFLVQNKCFEFLTQRGSIRFSYWCICLLLLTLIMLGMLILCSITSPPSEKKTFESLLELWNKIGPIQLAFTYSKSTMETPEQCMKYVKS